MSNVACIVAGLLIELFAIGKVMEKMGEPCWKGWVPLYNFYILYSKVWSSSMFFCFVLLNIGAGCGLKGLNQSNGHTTVSLLLCLIMACMAMLIRLAFYINCAKSFRCSPGLSIIGMICPFLFFIILWLKKADFVPVNSNQNLKEGD